MGTKLAEKRSPTAIETAISAMPTAANRLLLERFGREWALTPLFLDLRRPEALTCNPPIRPLKDNSSTAVSHQWIKHLNENKFSNYCLSAVDDSRIIWQRSLDQQGVIKAPA
jgi:hypothetical protein